MEYYKLGFFVGIAVLAVGFFAIFYPTPLSERIHPKMTLQQIEWIKNHPTFPFRFVAIYLFPLAGGIILVSFVWFKLEKRLQSLENSRKG